MEKQADNPIEHTLAKLEDTVVLALRKTLAANSCNPWTSAFTNNGHVRIERMLIGKPPVAEAFGVKWLYLIDGRCILTGAGLAEYFPWIDGNSHPEALRFKGQEKKSAFTIRYDDSTRLDC